MADTLSFQTPGVTDRWCFALRCATQPTASRRFLEGADFILPCCATFSVLSLIATENPDLAGSTPFTQGSGHTDPHAASRGLHHENP